MFPAALSCRFLFELRNEMRKPSKTFQPPWLRSGVSVLCSHTRTSQVSAGGNKLGHSLDCLLERGLLFSNKMLMATWCWNCVISMRLPFTSMNWILFLSLAVVRGDFFFKQCFCGFPVPPALLLLMAGKVSFGMCGGWHIWNRRSFYPRPRKFWGWGQNEKKNQN